MIDFKKACIIAEKTLTSKGYVSGFSMIKENGDTWFFFGLHNREGISEYGNDPVSVDKKTGKCETEMIFSSENLSRFLESNIIDVPKEYKIS